MILRSHVLRGIISLGKAIIYEWPAEKQGPISLCFITIQNQKGERLALSRLQKMGGVGSSSLPGNARSTRCRELDWAPLYKWALEYYALQDEVRSVEQLCKGAENIMREEVQERQPNRA